MNEKRTAALTIERSQSGSFVDIRTVAERAVRCLVTVILYYYMPEFYWEKLHKPP